eukprot:403351795
MEEQLANYQNQSKFNSLRDSQGSQRQHQPNKYQRNDQIQRDYQSQRNSNVNQSNINQTSTSRQQLHDIGIEDCDLLPSQQVFTPVKSMSNLTHNKQSVVSHMKTHLENEGYSKQIIDYNTNESATYLRQKHTNEFKNGDNFNDRDSEILNKSKKEQMIESIQNEIEHRKQELRELIDDLKDNEGSSKFSKRIINSICSLEEFLSLAFDAIKMQNLDIHTQTEQIITLQQEGEHLKDQISEIINDKDAQLFNQEKQANKMSQTIQSQEEEIEQLKFQLEQRTQDYELLKSQLLIKDTLHLAQEQMSSQKQYFENIAFQNNHLQLELKKISEQFREYVQKHEQAKVQVNESNSRRHQVLDEKFYVNKHDLESLYDDIIHSANQSKNEKVKETISERFKSRVKLMLQEQEYGMLITSQMRLINDLVKSSDQNENYHSNNIQSIQTQYSQSELNQRSNFKSDLSNAQDDSNLSKHDVLQIEELDNQYKNYIQQINENQNNQQPLSTRSNQNRSHSKNNIIRAAKSSERVGKQSVKFNDKKFTRKISNNNSRKNTPFKENEQQQQLNIKHEKCLTKSFGDKFDISKELKNLKSQSPNKIDNSSQRFDPKENLRQLINQNQVVNAQQVQSQNHIYKANLIQIDQNPRIETQKIQRLSKVQKQLQSDNVVLYEYQVPEPILQSRGTTSRSIISNNKSKSRQNSKFQHDYESTSFNQQAQSPMGKQQYLRNNQKEVVSPLTHRDRTISPDKLKCSTSPNKMYNLGITVKDYKPLQRGDSSERRSVLTNSITQQSGLKLQKNFSQKSIGVYNQSQNKNYNTQKASQSSLFSVNNNQMSNLNRQSQNSFSNSLFSPVTQNRSQNQYGNTSNFQVNDQDRQVNIKKQITQRAADKMKAKYLEKQRSQQN